MYVTTSQLLGFGVTTQEQDGQEVVAATLSLAEVRDIC